MDKVELRNFLRAKYFNLRQNPGAFGSVINLYKAAKRERKDISLSDVEFFLKSEETYGVHFPHR